MKHSRLTTIKKGIIFAGICVALLAAVKIGDRMLTKRFSPEAQAVYEHGDMSMIVNYCQPSKKGRDIFGFSGLVPYGEVWRTGANEATEVSLTSDVLLGTKKLLAGTYSMFTIPDENGWTIIFNEELDQWGAFDYDEQLDVLRVQVPEQSTDEIVEQFTIGFVETDSLVNMELRWDNTLVSVPFSLEQ